jgi:hypothetical protein
MVPTTREFSRLPEVFLKGIPRCARLAALTIAALAVSRAAAAAPEVHRFNLVLSSNPTQLQASDLNDFIGDHNRLVLAPHNLADLDRISFAWLHQAELRYFVRPNVAVSAGAGQIRSQSRREFLPRISQTITLRADVISVPLHVGATYYLAPYTQGDFQARAYLSGGFLSLTNNKVVFEQIEFQTDSSTTLGGSQRFKARGDGPGFFFEIGGHMFFASRFSVMLGGMYRQAKVRPMRRTNEILAPGGSGTIREELVPGLSFPLDTGGIGVRMAMAIGF